MRTLDKRVRLADTFRCGHPREPENIQNGGRNGAICRTCQRRRNRDSQAKADPQTRFLAYRIRVLPGQLEAAERKVAALRNEARRYGMTELLVGQEA